MRLGGSVGVGSGGDPELNHDRGGPCKVDRDEAGTQMYSAARVVAITAMTLTARGFSNLDVQVESVRVGV